MRVLETADKSLSVVLKLIIIVALILFAVYIGLAVGANIFEGNQPTSSGMPSMSDAQYKVILTTSGVVLLTDKYDQPSPGKYLLHGYYDYKQGKWERIADDLELDEYYFGKIKVEVRKR